MGRDVWRVVFAEPSAEGGVGTRCFEYDEKSARFWAKQLDGQLFRKEEVGADGGVMAMSNPAAYDWKRVE